jgi:hypothetical protein
LSEFEHTELQLKLKEKADLAEKLAEQNKLLKVKVLEFKSQNERNLEHAKAQI